MLMNRRWLGTLAVALMASVPASAQSWKQVGPPGGTVISLGTDPHNAQTLYLGTSDGHVFVSNDQAAHWQLLSRIGTGQDDVITHIIVDSRNSKHLFASTWTLYSGGGGVYESSDAGHTWKLAGLQRETVRALAQSPTNPKVLVAGSLTGVYRSSNEGKSWERISPANHPDLKNFDSVAFDPHDDNIIYAGTYHLAWKTSNGGKDWFPIHAGMIDDSDVMSIVVDPANPQNVHATACSGIYRSTDAAQKWTRYSSIPFVYRRTQLIRQDPANPEVLYAGTTSGLWKTTNEKDFKRLTPVNWIINAIVIDPKNPQRVIIGTQREGVQVSNNGGETFTSANAGFQHQHILDVAMDHDRPERALVVLTFDTDPFLATRDGGATWTTLGPGLKRTEMRHVYASPNGWWASLTKGGWMKYDDAKNRWVKAGMLVADSAAGSLPVATSSRGKKTRARKAAPLTRKAAAAFVAYQVNDMEFSRSSWFAATAGGVLVSHDQGSSWSHASKDSFTRLPADSVELSADGSRVWAISRGNLLYSADGGARWDAQALAFGSAGNLKLNRVDDAGLYITSNMGLYASHDAGRTWTRADVRELQFQSVAGSGNDLVVALQKQGLLASNDGGKSWQRVRNPLAEGYFPIVRARRNGGLVAVSATEGMLSLQPHESSASTGVGTTQLVVPSDLQKPR